jgi:hypothetical protein
MPARNIASSLLRLGRGAGTRLRTAPSLAWILLAALPARLRGEARQPQLILHAGGHKTGTTSIQAMILNARGALAAQGVHVLRTGQGRNGAHHRLIAAFDGQPLGRLATKLLQAELRHAHPRKVLVSSELAKNVIVNGRGGRLLDGLRQAGVSRVQLLLYLRSPFGLANAAYSELTASLALGGASFAEFLSGHDTGPAYRYDQFLDLARRDDMDLIVRPYSEAVRRSVAADFAQAIGVDFGQAQEPRHNSSLGPVGLEALRRIAAECAEIDAGVQSRLAISLRAIAAALPEAPFWAIDAAHEAMLETADRRTDAFARVLWGTGWREAIGEERRPLNLFDPGDHGQQALLDSTLRRMRHTAFGSGGTPHEARRSLITRST